MRQDKVDSGLTRLKNFIGLWGIETVPHCLVSGPGVMRWVESGPESESHGGGGSSGLVGLQRTAHAFTISRNWLTPRGPVLPESARPQDVKVPAYRH